MLPCLLVTAPAATGGSDVWPYRIVYDNVLHRTPRPPLFHVHNGARKRGGQPPRQWSGGGAALAAQEAALLVDPLGLAARAMARVVYADADVIVVDKPSGLLCVPGLHSRFSLASAACAAFGLGEGFVSTAICHRLDEATSGVVVFARTAAAQKHLHEQFRCRAVRKRYTALVHRYVTTADKAVNHDNGTVTARSAAEAPSLMQGGGGMGVGEGEVDLPLARHPTRQPWQVVDPLRGKPSLTHWKVIEHFYRTPPPFSPSSVKGARSESAGVGVSPVSRVELTPVTGRSHQLRVHMAAIGHPILGDDLYGEDLTVLAHHRLCLHATSITFTHPTTGSPVAFEVGCPF
jgi:tRNA pseudouridine32 synthase/23S rRNA pseudouridine746 synthase